MASTSQFRYGYNQMPCLNAFSSRSAFKWTSQSNNSSKTTLPKSSTTVASSSAQQQLLQPQSVSSSKYQENANFARGRSHLVKIVDDKRIRTVLASSIVRKVTTPVMVKVEPLSAKKNPAKSACIRYDPNLRTLVKTIDLRPPIPAPTPVVPKLASSLMKPTPSLMKVQAGSSKNVVSRFKVIRNSAPTTQLSRQIKVSRPPSVCQNKPPRPGNRQFTKIISKYKLRRRTASFSSPVKKRRLGNPFPNSAPCRQSLIYRGGLIGRYKVVRKATWMNGDKTLYRIDRRRERKTRPVKASYHHQGSHRTKYRLRRNSVSRIAKRMDAHQSSQRSSHCLFYIRYGRCCRGSSCQLIHDPAKVAVCTRFLRGTCKVRDCPFSHVVSPDKMPLCRFYLLGKCIRSDCPYLHVKHASSAQNCADFERGFCPKGAKCDKKHTARNCKRYQPCVKVEHTFSFSNNDLIAKDRGKAGSFISSALKFKLASRPQKKEVIDLAAGPLPEFIPLVKDKD